jgi:hypothetical protein
MPIRNRGLGMSLPHMYLTLILLPWRIWWAPNNASKWKMGYNSTFKGLRGCLSNLSSEPYVSRRLKFATTKKKKKLYIYIYISAYESNGTLFHLTTLIHYSLRPFSVTPGSKAITVIRMSYVGVYAFKFSFLEFIWGFYSQYSKSALEMFPFGTQTPNI